MYAYRRSKHRHSLLRFLAVASLLPPMTGGVARAREMSYAVSTPQQAVRVETGVDFTVVEVLEPGFTRLREAGLPTLPFRVVRVLLPPGEVVGDYSVTGSPRKIIASGVRLVPAPPPRTSAGATGKAAPFPAHERGAAGFPGRLLQHMGTAHANGYTIASFAVFPLQVENETVFLHEYIELHLTTRGTRSSDAADRKRLRPELEARVRAELASRVVNPEWIDAYSPPQPLAGPGPGGFQPTEAPSLEGSAVDYLIVTSAALEAEYQRLADWKTSKGVATVVRTTEWIESNCRNGVDLAETIRFFIRDAYEKWGIEFVLLGGDTDVIPARYAYSRYLGDGTPIPADLYFACLDGSWNDDHDQYWGEASVDDADLYAEVYVGRLPTSTTADASTMIDKIIAYETPAQRDYTDRVRLLAEVLFPSDWSEGDPIVNDGAEHAESLYVSVFQGKPLQTARMYQTHAFYPGSVPITRAAVVDSMDAGANVINHIGHGSRFNFSCGDVSFINSDADALVNGDRLFLLFLVDCNVAAFDYYCIAEHFLRNPNGGAVAAIGASHLEFPAADAYYMTDFYDFVFNQGVCRIGEAFARSRLSQTPWAETGENVDRWTHYVYTLLSDPELAVWTGSVDTATVVHPASVALGTSNVAVTVTSGGQPVDSAVVCLYKTGDDYRRGVTDAAGNVSIEFTAESPGSIGVVVTGRNIARHQSAIAVNPSLPAYVHHYDAVVDDDTLGGTFGNGDGMVDAGETVDFTLMLINTGEGASGNVAVVVHCGDSLVSIVDSTASVAPIAPDAIAAAFDPVRVTFDTDIADETVVEFALTIEDDLSGQWGDVCRQTVHAPQIELTTLRIDDDPPLGNGNGVNEPLEEFLLFYGIKNYGTGAASGLLAQLTDVDGAFVFFDSTDAYPDCLPFASCENTSGFHIVETTTSGEHLLAVEVVDLFGRTHRDTIELRIPAPPTALSFDASHAVDEVEVMWTKSASPDVARYNVYHSLTSGGPYDLVSVDAVSHTVFMDTDLAPNTRYYYVVTSIDSAGNQSAASAEASVSTNPPQLGGFPIEMQGGATSPPAVGDIDGDGDKEIVVGSNYVYAWHHDGLELFDGDGDPQTWGILSTAGDQFTGAIVLSRLDANPGLDIIAADLFTKSVHCMDHKGDALPGWPRVGENQFRAAPVAGDVDGDGLNEIVAVDAAGVIYAWNADGSELIDGDLNPATDGVFFRTPTTSFHYHTPALCDIDSDGRDEIILGTRSSSIYALNDDGSAVPGWPFALPGEAAGSVAVGDVDDDGEMEVVCHTKSTHVYLLNHDATVATGWPRYIPINEPFFCPSPALADFDGDDKLEIVLVGNTASATRLCLIKANGLDYPGWPVVFNVGVATECSPVVADIDGDGALDIVVGDESRFLYAFDLGGQPIDGFPIATGDAVRATPFVEDIDDDGDTEVIAAGWDSNLYVWDLAGSYVPQRAPWPTFHANVHRNGCIDFLVPTSVNRPARVAVSEPALLQNYPNPFNPATVIVFHVPDGAPQRVTLRIFDVTGALVHTLVDDIFPAGRHEVVWRGRDERGERVATGLYFYEIRQRGFVAARKMLLLK